MWRTIRDIEIELLTLNQSPLQQHLLKLLHSVGPSPTASTEAATLSPSLTTPLQESTPLFPSQQLLKQPQH